MDELRAMPKPTRADLENAARRYFARLVAELDQPRNFDPTFRDVEIVEQIDASVSRIDELEIQLVDNVFDPRIIAAASEIASILGLDVASFTPLQTIVASQLAAKAQREQLRLYIHQLQHPGDTFKGDPFFSSPVAPSPARIETAQRDGARRSPDQRTTLKDISDLYLKRKENIGVGSSQVTELRRAFSWLREEFGDDRPLKAITPEELRYIRDGISRLDVTLRGRDAPFRDRQTNQRDHQIKSATSTRYWKSIQAFFAWAVSETYIAASPAATLNMDIRKDDVKVTPPPFDKLELERLFGSPLYAGYRGPKRLMTPGPCQLRLGHWWSGILALYTGMRAGELCQLNPTDFSFDTDIPFVRITDRDADGMKTKKTKNASSVRDIPIHAALVELGLRQFVIARAKAHRTERVFLEFRLGSNGRSSEGMTAFWGAYLRRSGVWAPGRSTHMFRHTVADTLRANGAMDEDIGAILGHSGRTITARYGGGQPLARKAETLKRLNYGFDVVAALGGPYDKKRHSP